MARAHAHGRPGTKGGRFEETTQFDVEQPEADVEHFSQSMMAFILNDAPAKAALVLDLGQRRRPTP
jgi:hypothetical protein